MCKQDCCRGGPQVSLTLRFLQAAALPFVFICRHFPQWGGEEEKNPSLETTTLSFQTQQQDREMLRATELKNHYIMNNRHF